MTRQSTSSSEGHRESRWRRAVAWFSRRGCWLLFCLLVAQPNVAETGQAVPLLLGMSSVFSGTAAELGLQMRQGVLAGIQRINRQGGVRGRSLALLALDDGYEPSRTAPNMRILIEEQEVLAVVGNVGTPTAIAAIPIVNRNRTLLFAPFTGAGVLRKHPPERYIINYRASYEEETAAMVDALVTHARIPLEQIAFFTQRDGYGDAGFAGGVQAMRKHGLRDATRVLHVRYERNTLAVENALADLLLRDPPVKALIMVGAYAPTAKLIQLARGHGLEALFLSVSFVGSDALVKALGEGYEGVIVTQVVPHFMSDLPLVAEFRADLREMDPLVEPSFGSLEGYIGMRILGRALNSLEREPDRESLVDAIEGLGQFDLGLGFPLTLSPAQHQASHGVWPTILRAGQFVPFHWPDLARQAERSNPAGEHP
ncbi:MAG: ABC transporter substrate-binding protein [Magnetococcus sp. XQGC-1]